MTLAIKSDVTGVEVEIDSLQWPWDRYTNEARCVVSGGLAFFNVDAYGVVFS